MAKGKKNRVVVEVRGGAVCNVSVDNDVELYLLDYDNDPDPTKTSAEQTWKPLVGEKYVNYAITAWDKTRGIDNVGG